jgi:hypothetical protein
VRLISGTNKSCGTFVTPFVPGKFRPTPIRNDGTATAGVSAMTRARTQGTAGSNSASKPGQRWCLERSTRAGPDLGGFFPPDEPFAP